MEHLFFHDARTQTNTNSGMAHPGGPEQLGDRVSAEVGQGRDPDAAVQEAGEACGAGVVPQRLQDVQLRRDGDDRAVPRVRGEPAAAGGGRPRELPHPRAHRGQEGSRRRGRAERRHLRLRARAALPVRPARAREAQLRLPRARPHRARARARGEHQGRQVVRPRVPQERRARRLPQGARARGRRRQGQPAPRRARPSPRTRGARTRAHHVLTAAPPHCF